MTSSILSLTLPAEEVQRRGEAIYERDIRALVEVDQQNRIVVIDVHTGAYAVGDSVWQAAEQVRKIHPDAVIWAVRVGHRALR